MAAIADEAIRAAIAAHFVAIGADAEAAGAIYDDDAVLEYVQSGERIVGRTSIMASRSAYPGRPSSFEVTRISGSGEAWVAELVLHIEGEDPHFVAAVLTVREGRVVREAIYIAEPWDPPAYRAPWVSR
jgi:hypothetical protein